MSSGWTRRGAPAKSPMQPHHAAWLDLNASRYPTLSTLALRLGREFKLTYYEARSITKQWVDIRPNG